MGLWEDVVAKSMAEFPKLKIRELGSTWISRFIKWISPGTTGLALFNSVYISADEWGKDKGAETLSHEMAHIRDQHKLWILYFVLYWLPPIGPSLKAVLEWRGYRENLRWIHEHPISSDPEYNKYLEDYYCQWVAGQFSSAMYLWMWPFKKAMYRKSQDFIAKL